MLSYSHDIMVCNQGPDVGKFKSEFPSDFHILVIHVIQELDVSLLEISLT